MSGSGSAHRDEVWSEAGARLWDVVVVGGGITGAGVAREAARLGLSVLLVEQRDFAWGTSGRSSKMIHGGLRYLRERQIQLTREAMRAREDLLRRGPGLVEPLRFVYAIYKGDRPGPWTLDFGLTVYDRLKRGGQNHHSLDHPDVSLLAPNLKLEGLRASFGYTDAQTDDARLVFRVLREAEVSGARALNYVRVEELLRDKGGNVRALAATDLAGHREAEVRTRSVVSAAGVWGGELGGPDTGVPDTGKSDMEPDTGPDTESLRLRPLRGSHLVFAQETFPTAVAVAFAHPRDGRPVFAYPWEGVTLVGTTDLDHGEPLHEEPAATREEVGYLLEAVAARFRNLSLSASDVRSTYAGVRPVVFSGREDPSGEPRECAILVSGNLVTVAGGKLTTFHPIARATVARLATVLDLEPEKPEPEKAPPESLEPPSKAAAEKAGELLSPLPHLLRRRLVGRLGPDLEDFLGWLDTADLEKIPGTPYTWAELRWAFEKEAVVHLEDLLLRRVRLGHLLPEGGRSLGTEIEARLQRPRSSPGWNPAHWKNEWTRYEQLWNKAYSPVPRGGE